MAKKRSVGLVVLITDPFTGEMAAVLWRRGRLNPVKGSLRESWRGACQVLIHGRVEDEESDAKALFREAKEEISFRAASYLPQHTLGLTLLTENLSGEEDVLTYGFLVETDKVTAFLREIKLEVSSGGLELLQQSELQGVRDLGDFNKTVGVTDLTVIAMFPDEKEAVHLAFEKLTPKDED